MFANIERNRESFEREKMAENSLKSFKLAELFFLLVLYLQDCSNRGVGPESGK